MLGVLGALFLHACAPGSTPADTGTPAHGADAGAGADHDAGVAADTGSAQPDVQVADAEPTDASNDAAADAGAAPDAASVDTLQPDSAQPDSTLPDTAGPDSWVAPPYNDAEPTGQSIPSSAVAGGTVSISVSFTNSGTTTWSRADGYWLGSEGPRDNLTWGTNRIALDAQQAVAPGETYTFSAALDVPAATGSYTMQWQMLQDAVEWFGDPSAQVIVEVWDDGGGPRTPDPPPGEQLPLPNMSHVVLEVADQYPSALADSCQDEGGTWEFMDRVVDRLRETDTRWGYNWKRGVVGDPSQDVVDYHWGPGPDENSTDVYIIDIITGHCGPDPQAGWIDVTQATADAGTIGRWTGRGRF